MAEQPIAPVRSRFRTLSAARESSIPIEADDLVTLAKRYADQGMFDESIHLYEMAEKLKPGSVAIRINLARVRDQKRDAEETRFTAVRTEVVAERARDEIDSSQYVGLAQYYMAKDQTSKAIELLEIAKLKTPNNYRPFEILGRLYYSQGEWDQSHEEIGKARTLNPFDRGLAEIAGRIEFELKDFDKALDDFIDAFLLATDQKGDATEPVRRMINTLKRLENIEAKELNARIKERVEQLQLCTERLELRKETLFQVESKREMREILKKITRDAEKRDNLILISAELRKLGVFQHMKDEQLFHLSKFARIETLGAGGYVFREDDRSMDFFVVRDRERGLSAAEMKLLATFSTEERFREGSMIFREGEKGDKLYIALDGRVRISKFIPGVGEEALAVLDRGDFFGEMALIDDKPRSADAKAHETDATVLSIDRATLNEILSMDPHASLQFLNLLCRMISRRLREINDKIVQWKYMSGGF